MPYELDIGRTYYDEDDNPRNTISIEELLFSEGEANKEIQGMFGTTNNRVVKITFVDYTIRNY